MQITADLPALPARGHTTTVQVASRTTPGTAYPLTVSVALWTGVVHLDCGCPARRGCWHRDTAEAVYVARGEAVRDPAGALVTTETQPAAPDDDDPFAGLLGEVA